MSLTAYVVCEDHTLDQYVVVPVIKTMLSKLGKPNASVRAVTNPRLTGIDDLMGQFAGLAGRYAEIGDLVIFAVDRDARDGAAGRGDRRQAILDKLTSLDESAAAKAVAVVAVEEIEVWALWGSQKSIATPWADVRAERDSKEAFFDPLVTKTDMQVPGVGRSRLIKLSLDRGWDSLLSACPELKELQEKVAEMI